MKAINLFPEGINREHQAIPDDDVPGWIKTLREGGFSDKTIDAILMRANKTYRQEKGKSVAWRKAHAVARTLADQHNKHLTEDEIRQIAHSFEVPTRGVQDWTQDE